MSDLVSIYAYDPTGDGGRIARIGFIYQDHVGAKYLLDLILESDDSDIIFESEDDIVVVEKTKSPIVVEMIQVKSNNLTSRWSVSQLVGLEVVQKSLKRGKCTEDVKYKVITSYDVDSDLEILKLAFKEENRDKAKLNELAATIQNKENIPPNAKGHTIQDWVNNCIWCKYPDSIESLKNMNLILLEKVLKDCYSTTLLFDQKQELYQKFLVLVQEASSTKLIIFNKNYLEEWLDQQLKNFADPKGGTEKLIEKMRLANIDSTLIESAKELKWAYTRDSLDNIYTSQSAINKFKLDALATLNILKVQLDSGDLVVLNINDGKAFHKFCVEKITTLAAENNISSAIAQGGMYEITNRCSHRFSKATI